MNLSIVIVLILAWLSAQYTALDAETRLRAIGTDIDAVESQLETDTPPPRDRLDSAIAALSQMIERPGLNDRNGSITYYLRAKAQYLVNRIREETGLAPDPAMARAALNDYDIVIAKGTEIRDWGITRAEATYRAGSTAYNHVKAEALAYSYWEKCAQENHMGCLNLMAGAKLMGSGSQTIDIPKAIDLHVRVYNTGTAYTCAGMYSAESISVIAHFTGVMRENEGALVWLGRAQDLADNLASMRAAGGNNTNPCGRELIDVAEYLIRLENGEDVEALLERARGRENLGRPEATAIQYLSGEMDDATFNTIVGAYPAYDRCNLHFIATWLALIQKQTERAREHHKAMKATDECQYELAYLRKYNL